MEEVFSIGQLINKTFANISVEDVNNAGKRIDSWKKVLLKISSNRNPNEGQNLADHSKVIDFKNGTLLVEADHPGWIELLQLHKKFILNGLRMNKAYGDIQNIVFRLKGKKADIYDFDAARKSDEDVRRMIEKNIQDQEKALKNSGYNFENPEKNAGKEAQEVPEELKKLMESFKNDIIAGTK